MENFIRKMKGTFGARLIFVGLHGSRGETKEDSDFDVMLLLNCLDFWTCLEGDPMLY